MRWFWTVSLVAVVLAVVLASSAQAVTWDAFVIRGTPAINTPVAGEYEFVIAAGGQKAGLGTSAIDGATVGEIQQLAISRLDNYARFSAGSGPYVAPYFNIWVTDGLGHYAVIANEPSDAAFQALYVGGAYDLDYADLANKVAKVYETPGAGTNTDWVHALVGHANLTFADLAGLKIEAPSAAYITLPANAVSSGAPREFGTNTAYGFTWMFGDTLSNYTSGDPGYLVGNFAASASTPTPEPVTASLALLGVLGLGLHATRRQRV